MAAITTEAELRAVIGAEPPGLADKNQPQLDAFAIAFIAKSPFLVLSTADAEGRVDASPKGDAPGFVVVENERRIVVPDRPGNRLAYGHRNILANPQAGAIFMIPGTPETLRVSGRAELSADPELLQQLAARGKPAVLAIRLHIEEVFFHCAKAFIRAGLWQPETWQARHKVSFGKMYAARNKAAAGTAAAIDAAIAVDYRDNL